MASPDDAATDQPRDPTDVKVVFVAGVYTVVLTLSLEYGAGVEMPLAYRLSPLAPYSAYILSRSATLSAQTWMALIAVVTLSTPGFFVL